MAWSWFKETAYGQELKRHELQTFLDTVAYAENLPLRILDLENLRQLSALDLWKIAGYSCKNSTFDCSCENMLIQLGEKLKTVFNNAQQAITQTELSLDITDTEKLRTLDRKIWLNLPSNPWPLQSLLRLSDEWRWFILVWFYLHKNEILNNAENKQAVPAFYMGELWEFYFHPIQLDSHADQDNPRYFLVIGPLYKPASNRTARIFYQEQGIQFIRCATAFFEVFAKKSLTRKPRDETIARALLARRPYTPDAIQERIEAIEFQFVSVLKLLTDEAPEYRYSEYFALARAFVAVERWPSKLAESIAPINEPVPLSFRFVLPPLCSLDFQITATMLDNKRLVCDSAQWISQAILQPQSGTLPPFLSDLVLNKNEVHFIGGKQSALDRLNLRLERWDERIHERRHIDHIERLNMLLDWLHDHTGEFGKKLETKHRRLHDYICNYVLEGLRADYCHLYRLEHSDHVS